MVSPSVPTTAPVPNWSWRTPLATRDVLVVLLVAASGFADALGYLGLGHVFTANMTGNTILLGLALGQGQSPAVLRSLTALAGFALGVLSGTRLAKRADHAGLWPASVTAVLTLECVPLVTFILWGTLAAPSVSSGTTFALIAVLATTQGMQSAAVRALGVVGVSSTAATGIWVSLFGGLSAWLRLPHAVGGAAMHARRAGVGLDAAVLGVYLAAAAAAGLAESKWRLAAAALPAAVVAFVVVTAFVTFRRASPREAGMHS